MLKCLEMNEKGAEKRYLAKEVKMMIAEGEPKEKILEELSERFKDQVMVMKILENTPSKVKREIYGTMNMMLLLLLILTMVADIVMIFDTGAERKMIFVNLCTSVSIVLDVIFIVAVLRYKVELYLWIFSRAFVSMIIAIVLYIHDSQYVDRMVYVAFGLTVFSTALGMWLAGKLCPKRVPKKVTLSNGRENIISMIYVYPD